MYESNLGVIARAGLQAGVDGLRRFQLQVMSPIVPMLAQTADDVDEALQSLAGDVAFEWKMDGARIQVHKHGRRGAHLHARPQRSDGGDSGDRRRRAQTTRGSARARRRGHRVYAGGPAARVPDHHAPLRPQARRRADAAGVADARVLLRLPAARRRQPRGAPDARTIRRARRGRAGRAARFRGWSRARTKRRPRFTTRRSRRGTKA